MRFTQAAGYFNKLQALDAYTGVPLFLGKLRNYEDAVRDAIGAQRRILMVRPGVQMPSRHAIEAPIGTRWVIGSAMNPDAFSNATIREKYILHRAEGLVNVNSPGEVILDEPGHQAYAGKNWIKDWREESSSSNAYPYYEFYFALTEPVLAGHYLRIGQELYRVRSTFTSEAGYLAAKCDDIAASLVSIAINGLGWYDAGADQTVFPEQLVTMGLVFRPIVNYHYRQESAPENSPGDLIALVRKEEVPAVQTGSTVDHAGMTYRVLSGESEMDCWRIHLRP